MGRRDCYYPKDKTAGIKIIALYLFYFLFFSQLATTFTLWLDPEATYVNQGIAIVLECIIAGIFIFISRDLWLSSMYNFKYHWKRNICYIVGGFIIIIALNYIVSPILIAFTKESDSANQKAIVASLRQLPVYMIVSTVFIAPIIEETLFRVAIFGALRKRYSFYGSAICSSVLFGVAHVLNSLLSGDMKDLPFIIIYIGVGFVLALVYEKTKNITVNVGVHLLNNLISVLLIL